MTTAAKAEPNWKGNQKLPTGKGATLQECVATVGAKTLAIDVAPWGEGHLKVNGRKIAHVNDAKDGRQAFRELKIMANRYMEGQHSQAIKIGSAP